ncbi:hypothetical protein GN956_G24346 [Arapaima gigas]
MPKTKISSVEKWYRNWISEHGRNRKQNILQPQIRHPSSSSVDLQNGRVPDTAKRSREKLSPHQESSPVKKPSEKNGPAWAMGRWMAVLLLSDAKKDVFLPSILHQDLLLRQDNCCYGYTLIV